MGLLDSVGGFPKDAGDGIGHTAGNGHKAASDAWNTAFEDAKASANVVGGDSSCTVDRVNLDSSAKAFLDANRADISRSWIEDISKRETMPDAPRGDGASVGRLPPGVHPQAIPSPDSIDLLADPRGQAIENVLPPELKNWLDKKFDVEGLVRDQIKDLQYKPFELAFEAQKKAIQEKAGETAAVAAVAMCGGPELPTSALCAVAGFGAGWYSAGKAFDKAIQIPIDSITSPSAPSKP